VMRLVPALQAAQDGNRVFDAWLSDKDGLKPPL